MKRNCMFTIIALALGTAGLVSVAHAQDTTATAQSTIGSDNSSYTKWYIAPRIGVVIPDNDRQVQNAPIAGLGVGVWASPHFTLDLEVTNDDADYKDSFARAGKEWETIGADIAGRYYFLEPESKWRPYLMLGVGVWRYAPVSGRSGSHSGQTAGVGVLYNINDRIALRGEIAVRRYRDNLSAAAAGLPGNDNSRHWLDTLATVGLIFNFGHPAPPPPPPAAPPPPPPPAAPPPPPPPQHVVIDLRGVNFKFDRPRQGEHDVGPALKPPAADSMAILNQAVDTLNRYPQVKIEIDGYTDSIGTDKYNQGLSERRAHIVADYLTGHGVDASRITTVQGFGETNPIDTNKTDAGRQRNRRVEFKVEQPPEGGSM